MTSGLSLFGIDGEGEGEARGSRLLFFILVASPSLLTVVRSLSSRFLFLPFVQNNNMFNNGIMQIKTHQIIRHIIRHCVPDAKFLYASMLFYPLDAMAIKCVRLPSTTHRYHQRCYLCMFANNSHTLCMTIIILFSTTFYSARFY